MKRPQLQDFGATAEDYNLYRSRPVSVFSNTRRTIPGTYTNLENRILWSIALPILLLVFCANYVLFQSAGLISAIVITVVFAAVPIGISSAIAQFIVNRLVKHRQGALLKSSTAVQIESYEQAVNAYEEWVREQEQKQQAERARQEEQRKSAEAAERSRLLKAVGYWESLSGIEFERELASLFKRLDYQVEMTPKSGDHGVDLVLKKDGKVAVVQCKRYSYPAGPAFARELLGTAVAYPADYGILACTGGFTQGVHEFVRDKPLVLMSAEDIVQLAIDAENRPAAASVSHRKTSLPRAQRTTPFCPICHAVMGQRTGRYGPFWSCPKWPKCKGTRDISYQIPIGD